MSDDDMIIYMRLVKAGYGSLREVMEFNAIIVLQALYYEKFVSDYERAYLEVNKP